MIYNREIQLDYTAKYESAYDAFTKNDISDAQLTMLYNHYTLLLLAMRAHPASFGTVLVEAVAGQREEIRKKVSQREGLTERIP